MSIVNWKVAPYYEVATYQSDINSRVPSLTINKHYLSLKKYHPAVIQRK